MRNGLTLLPLAVLFAAFVPAKATEPAQISSAPLTPAELRDGQQRYARFWKHGGLELKDYAAVVERVAVTPNGGGTEIFLRTTGGKYRRLDRRFSFDKGPLPTAERKLSFQWPSSHGPAPAAPGVEVTCGVDSKGVVQEYGIAIWITANYPVHQRPDGRWEALIPAAAPEGRDYRTVWLYIQPDYIDLVASAMLWTREEGLALETFNNGPGGAPESEQEITSYNHGGYVAANVQGLRIKIGRDGWVVNELACAPQGFRDFEPVGGWPARSRRAFRNVPPAQRIVDPDDIDMLLDQKGKQSPRVRGSGSGD